MTIMDRGNHLHLGHKFKVTSLAQSQMDQTKYPWVLLET